MARREKFDRSDVPEGGPLRTVFSLIALVVIGVLTVLLVRTVWTRAHLDDRLNDDALNSVLRNQYNTRVWEGSVISDKDFVVTLIVTVDGEIDSDTLSAVQLLVINRTDGVGTIVNIPLDTRYTLNGSKYTMSSAWTELGESEFIATLSWHTNVPADHIIVANRDVIEDIAAIKTFGPVNTITSRLLSSIRSDMRPKTLVSLAAEIQAIGLENFAVIEVPRWHDDPAEGDTNVPAGGWEVIHRTDLCYELGMFEAA